MLQIGDVHIINIHSKNKRYTKHSYHSYNPKLSPRRQAYKHHQRHVQKDACELYNVTVVQRGSQQVTEETERG